MRRAIEASLGFTFAALISPSVSAANIDWVQVGSPAWLGMVIAVAIGGIFYVWRTRASLAAGKAIVGFLTGLAILALWIYSDIHIHGRAWIVIAFFAGIGVKRLIDDWRTWKRM